MATSKHSVLIIDDEQSIRESLSLVLTQEKYEVETAADGEQALAKAAARTYDVALLDIRLPGIDGMEVLKRLRKITPDTCIIMITATKAISTAVEALKLGAVDYLTKPMNVDDLLKIIQRVLVEKKERAAQPGGAPAPGGPLAVSIFGNKGGVGKTTLACNLSAALASGSNKSVVLIDLNLQFGNAAVMLDVVPEKTIYDYLQSDRTEINDFLTVHNSGLRLLSGSNRWEEMSTLKGEDIKKILAELKKKYSLIIIDADKFLQEIVLDALNASDLVLYVLSPDIPSVRNASLGLDFLTSLYLSPQKISLILNCLSTVRELSDREIADYLGRPISFSLPNEPQVAVSAANKGVPFVLSQPDAAAAKAVEEIAQFLKTYRPPEKEA